MSDSLKTVRSKLAQKGSIARRRDEAASLTMTVGWMAAQTVRGVTKTRVCAWKSPAMVSWGAIVMRQLNAKVACA